MRNLLYLLLVGLLALSLEAGSARAAENSRFEVKILPENCLFEIINDGTNRIIYLTPEECGVEITEPTPEQTNNPDYVVPRLLPPYVQSPADPAPADGPPAEGQSPGFFSQLDDFVQGTTDNLLGATLLASLLLFGSIKLAPLLIKRAVRAARKRKKR